METHSPISSNALDAQGVVDEPIDRMDRRVKVTGGAREAYEMQQENTRIESEAAGAQRRSIVVAVIAVVAVAIPAMGLGASRSVAADAEAAPSPNASEYLPSISDLMIATIQPRYERLWRAEQDGNWEFAAYELGNLRGAFDRLGRAHPTEHGVSIPQMAASVTEQPFKELNGAIQAKDGAAFAKAEADLTNSCNACHQALNHGVVDIRPPSLKSRN
jgi:hypothetical protein